MTAQPVEINTRYPTNRALAKVLAVCGLDLEMLKYAESSFQTGVVAKAKSTIDYSLFETALKEKKILATTIGQERLQIKQDSWAGKKEEINKLLREYYADVSADSVDALKKLDLDQNKGLLINAALVYKIDSESRFVRGYLSDGKQLDPKIDVEHNAINVIDKSFHDWLHKQDLTCKKGVIYETNELDKEGNPIHKADPEAFAQLIADPKKGLESFIKKLDSRINLQVTEHGAAPTPEADTSPE